MSDTPDGDPFLGQYMTYRHGGIELREEYEGLAVDYSNYDTLRGITVVSHHSDCEDAYITIGLRGSIP